MSDIEWAKTACNLCFVNCGIRVQKGGDDGLEILKVRGDDDHPISKGYICNKASRINYYQNSNARIRKPMRRKQDGTYEEVSWDTAIREVSEKLGAIKESHGGERIFYYGGGGQGNHLGGVYGGALRGALGVRYTSNALAQEKTGLSWVFSRMLGKLTHPDMEESDVVMFVGKNPFMSNGMDRARNFLRDISKNPNRTLIVADPRKSETSDFADIHLAVDPGKDAWYLTAIIAYLVQHDLLPWDWLNSHTTGSEKVVDHFRNIPYEDYAEFSGAGVDNVIQAAEAIGRSRSFVIEEDIGVQMAPHSTLVTYLNYLLMLLTGNYGNAGGLYPVKQLTDVFKIDYLPVDEAGREIPGNRKSLPVTGMPIFSGLFSPNSLADEILNDSEERARAMIVESSNPVHSLPDTERTKRAIRSLDFSVCIDVAMTETASECDYVLPASTQYEKWEATFFPRNYPESFFHLRKPVFPAPEGALSEPEIHCRIIDALNVFEDSELDALAAAAKKGLSEYAKVFMNEVMSNNRIGRMVPYVLYRTLGPSLPNGEEATAAVWGLAQLFALKYPNEVRRAGYSGDDLGSVLYKAIMKGNSGTIIGMSDPENDDHFAEIPHEDNKVQLVIGELLDEVTSLSSYDLPIATSADYPFILAAGSRRAYTANCNIRDPRWMKGKDALALTMNPDDAEALALSDGCEVLLSSKISSVRAIMMTDKRMKRGTVSIPNGQGMAFADENGDHLESGVFANKLTAIDSKDKFIGTPFHKFVPVNISRA